MKRLHHIFVLLLILLGLGKLSAQEQRDRAAEMQPDDFFISTYKFHPQLLAKKQWLIDFSTHIPKFFKYYNPKAGKIAPKMPVVVLNEAYFNAHILYGVSPKINLFVNLPFVSLHHYSPMMFQKGVGFGDVETGLVFGNLLKGNHYLTVEAQINWPTGIYLLKKQVLNTGMGAFGLQAGLSGLENLQNKSGAWQLAYHAYFDYLISLDKIQKGPAAGATLLFRKPFHTAYGYFGLENAWDFQYRSAFKAGPKTLPMTGLMQFDLSIGGWYEFLKHWYLRMAVPYTLYQNKAFLTKYSVVFQLDYQF